MYFPNNLQKRTNGRNNTTNLLNQFKANEDVVHYATAVFNNRDIQCFNKTIVRQGLHYNWSGVMLDEKGRDIRIVGGVNTEDDV